MSASGGVSRHRAPQRQAQCLVAVYQMDEQVKTYLEASKLARRTAACFSDKHRTRIRLAIIVQKLVDKHHHSLAHRAWAAARARTVEGIY